MSVDSTVSRVERLDLRLSDRPWRFAIERRAEIDDDFEQRRRANPLLWNGKVLLLHRHAIADGVFSGEFLIADFASLLAWKAWSRADAGVVNAFSATAVISSDGAVLLGEMAPYTANAGKIYFPCGTPDMGDVSDGRVDLEGSAARELLEETGIDIGTLDVESGWRLIESGMLIAAIKVAHAREDARTLKSRVEAHLAQEKQPELSAVRMVKSPAEAMSTMPDFVRAFLTHFETGQSRIRA